MPETEVETPAAPAAVEETPKEKEILEEAKKAEAEASATEEKKDEEKKEGEPEKKEAAKKEKKEKKAKEPAAPPPPAVHKKDFEQDVVYLYQFPRCPTLPNISPKCLQVETWLKLNGIKYENVAHNGKLRSKRGFLPFIELNGEEIADSDLIVKNLAKKYEKEMDDGLSNEQKNIQHAMLTMVDKHLHGTFLHWASRNADDMIKGYKLNLQQFTGLKVPNGILNFWFKFQHCRKGLKKAKAAVGTGYSNEEIDDEGKADLKVLKEMLGEKEFFFGEEPHSLDLVTFAHIAQIVNVDNEEVKCPLKEYLDAECTNLVGLYNRMKDRAWGDHWDEAIGEKLELNPHIPKPDPPKPAEEEEKKEGEAAAAAPEEKKEGEEGEAAAAAAKEEGGEKKEEDNKKEEEKEKSDEKEEKKDEEEKKE